FRTPPPLRESARAVFPHHDRHGAHRRSLRPSRTEGLHLHRDVVLARGRGPQYSRADEAGEAGGWGLAPAFFTAATPLIPSSCALRDRDAPVPRPSAPPSG